jgi:hypothetical protein
MIRLLYFSQSKDVISDEEIQSILQSSRHNNAGRGITGVLIYGGGLFMQVLEGPQQAVLRLYVKILDDRRHCNSQIIHITPTDKRIFEGWSMGSIKRSNSLEFEQILELRNLRKEVVQAKVFTDVMHEFLRVLKTGQ